jgi:hypothetical protein
MELDENNVPEEQDGDYVEIYSRRAIFWFSVIPFPLFGGILLTINLRAAGYKKAVYPVLIFSLLFTLGTEYLISWLMLFYKIVIPTNYRMDNIPLNEKLIFLSLTSILLNVIGGGILALYFSKKYFPDKDYYPKSVTVPLLIAILLVLFGRYFGV